MERFVAENWKKPTCSELDKAAGSSMKQTCRYVLFAHFLINPYELYFCILQIK